MLYTFSMDAFLPQQCAANSVGAANTLFGLLMQTLIAAQCSLSPAERWPKDYGKTALEEGLEEYDFIIVGAGKLLSNVLLLINKQPLLGSAGSVLANRLSENMDWKILLLEAGGDPPIESEVSANCH